MKRGTPDRKEKPARSGFQKGRSRAWGLASEIVDARKEPGVRMTPTGNISRGVMRLFLISIAHLGIVNLKNSLDELSPLNLH